ncbi:MAG: ATP-dependent helicase HrpB, partial [Planctomycetota bacterium]
MIPLPIDEFLPQVIDAVRRRRDVVLVAQPGAGKTTRLAPALVRGGLDGRLVMLQPRRVAARAAAARIAHEQGWTLGNEVGYQVRV